MDKKEKRLQKEEKQRESYRVLSLKHPAELTDKEKDVLEKLKVKYG